MGGNKSHRYGLVLWILLALFAFRVAAQLAVLFVPSTLLPDFEAWHSGVLPYWLLVVSQVAILALLAWTARQFSSGAVDPSRPAGVAALTFGALYFTTMLARLVLGLTVLSDRRWFSSRLPTFFHLVLASYLLVFAWFHIVHAAAPKVDRQDRDGGSEL